MTKAEQIFEKHIGLNAELGYLPIKKQDVIDAINEALTITDVSQQRELLKAFAEQWNRNGSQLINNAHIGNFLDSL